MQDDLRLTQDDPRVTQDDLRVTQEDAGVTQDNLETLNTYTPPPLPFFPQIL